MNETEAGVSPLKETEREMSSAADDIDREIINSSGILVVRVKLIALINKSLSLLQSSCILCKRSSPSLRQTVAIQVAEFGKFFRTEGWKSE